MTMYYTLVASLPALPPSFNVGPSPITASTLRHRLSILTDDDRRVVDQLSDFFRWDRQPIQRTDAEVIAMHRRLNREIDNSLVRRLIEHRFEMRTLVGAVRCQREGKLCPQLPELPVSDLIRRHWNQPGFQTSSRYPWLVRFCRAIENDQPQQAQRELFHDLWGLWSRLNQQYHFTFESIILYLARWEILHRWASQDAELGRQRFDGLVDGILAEAAASPEGDWADR